MAERCFWCNSDPDEAAGRHEGPHLKWCPHWRDPGLPEGASIDVAFGKRVYHFRPVPGAPLSGTGPHLIVGDELHY